MKDHKTSFSYIDEISIDNRVRLFNEQAKMVAYAVTAQKLLQKHHGYLKQTIEDEQ